MPKISVDTICWWIPFKNLRNAVRNLISIFFEKINHTENTINYLNGVVSDINNTVVNINNTVVNINNTVVNINNTVVNINNTVVNINNTVNYLNGVVSDINNTIHDINQYSINSQNLLYTTLNKLKENELKKKVSKNEKIKVIFLADHFNQFGCEVLYNLMANSKVYDPYILVYYNRDTFFDKNEVYFDDYLINYNLFETNGYKVIHAYDLKTKNLIDIDIISPDIIFFHNPNLLYDYSIFQNMKLNSKYLTCYINYGFNIFKFDYYHYNYPSINTAWINFVENNFNYQKHMNNQKVNTMNFKLVGSPKMDLYTLKTLDKCVVPKKIDNGKKIVIYAPHWTIENKGSFPIGTFHLYHRYFLHLLKMYPDINFVFRPHPSLFHTTFESEIITNSYYKNYMEEWDTSKNGLVFADDEYIDLFRRSDCLITDCGSFIAQYLPSENPCIYLINTEKDDLIKNTFNDFSARILKSYYLSYSEKDIDGYFKKIILDADDYKKEERLEVLRDEFSNIGNASENIIKDINKVLGMGGISN